MICPFCRAENIEGADECSNCGQPLYGLDAPEANLKHPAPDFIREPISRLPQRPPALVGTTDPVGMAIRTMQVYGRNCVLVMDGERMAGILTSSDILLKVAGNREDLNAVSCEEIMTAEPQTLEEDDSIAVAINVMAAGGFRHLPVVRNGAPVALIGVNDLFMYISPNLL